MELSYLRPLFDRPGPWASVHLDATRAEENAEHQIELRWRALRTDLARQGGDDVTGLTVGGAPRRTEVRGSESFPIRKPNVGGWSHRRYQQAAEETWKRNAGDIAAAVT